MSSIRDPEIFGAESRLALKCVEKSAFWCKAAYTDVALIGFQGRGI